MITAAFSWLVCSGWFCFLRVFLEEGGCFDLTDFTVGFFGLPKK